MRCIRRLLRWPVARLLGIDVGTTSAKALVIDESGQVLAQATSEYPLSIPAPGWSEQNPDDWWLGVQECLRGLGDQPIDAIGLTGQMHGAVFLSKGGEVLRPAILWNDQRTVKECAEIEQRVGKSRVLAITKNPPLTGFQAPKIMWLRNHEPEVFKLVRTVVLPKDYIRFRLSGVLSTDVSDASGTGVFDVGKRAWSEEVLEALDLPIAWFPPVQESSEVSSRKAGEGIPIVAGAGDQAAGAVGVGAVCPGITSISLGTSGVVFSSLPNVPLEVSESTHTFCHANGGWHAMGVTLSCGGSMRWARDTFFSGARFQSFDESAMSAPPGSDGLTCLPYLTGERCPHNDPLARGTFAGLTSAHGLSHIARSVFEGSCFSLLDAFHALEEIGITAGDLRVMGGGTSSDFWVQMLADVFRRPCKTLEVDEGPAFGAAILAGVGIGVWPDVAHACSSVVRMKREFLPSASAYGDAYDRYRLLYSHLAAWFAGL